MIRHAMDVIKNSVNYLNPGQIPVMTCDQSFFAIGNSIQWTWPGQYGEDKLVIILGGLHIEQAAWSTVGTWLEDSGWTQAIRGRCCRTSYSQQLVELWTPEEDQICA
ncbi:hypothetical protein ACOMHN_052763 [Nucella lapillus]